MSNFEIHAAAALERYDNGESVETIVADYPEHQAGLRAILETAGALERINLVPSAQAKARSQQAFLAEANTLPQSAARPLRMRRLQYLPVGVALVAAFVVLAWLSLARSNNTAPATIAPANEAAPEETLEQLENTPPPTAEEVQLRGLITAIDGSRWVVDGEELDIQPAVAISFTPAIGQEIAVTGIVHDNVVLVYELELLQDVASETQASTQSVVSSEPTTLTVEPATEQSPTEPPVVETVEQPVESTDDDHDESEDQTQELEEEATEDESEDEPESEDDEESEEDEEEEGD